MNITPFTIPDLKLIELDLKGDHRGFFVERFNTGTFEAAGLPSRFYQDNHSRSQPGTLRGLHFQYGPAQGKLVGAIRGTILDVALDIRPQSPTFGQWASAELSDQNARLLWVPPGFAHGFQVLGDEPADVLYKIDAPYAPGNELGIAWNDPQLAIDWQQTASPTLSDRDQNWPTFQDYAKNPIQDFSQ